MHVQGEEEVLDPILSFFETKKWPVYNWYGMFIVAVRDRIPTNQKKKQPQKPSAQNSEIDV